MNPGHLYLTGYRGSGKSCVAKELAHCLGVDLIDLDDQIELKAGKTIKEIFDCEGETGFRDREQSALEQMKHLATAVVALGGGAVLRDENRQMIRATGRCVWLDADIRTLTQRIHADAKSAQQRPNLTSLEPDQEVQQVLADRLPLYQLVADHRIDTTNQSVKDITELVLVWLADSLDESTDG